MQTFCVGNDKTGWYYGTVLAANYFFTFIFYFFFKSFALLLNHSFLETMLYTTTLFSLVLIEFANSTISLAISSEFL